MTDHSPKKQLTDHGRTIYFFLITFYPFYKVGVEIPQIITNLYWKWQTVIL